MNPGRYSLKSILLSALITVATILIVLSDVEMLRNPSKIPFPELASFERPDTLNEQLNYLQSVLGSLAKNLPPEVSLQYMGNEDVFPYFEAVLAPRRIGLELDSPYILVYAGLGESLQEYARQQHARLLLRPAFNIGILQRRQ